MFFTVNFCFGKKGLRCSSSKIRIEILFFSMSWSRGEIILVGFIVNRLIIRLLRILNSLRIIFWIFIKIFMPSLFLMFGIQAIWNNLLVLIFLSWFPPRCRLNVLIFLEIKNVVFNLNGNSAPGPDGFGGVFYHSCWEIIGTDVLMLFNSFLNKTGFSLE